MVKHRLYVDEVGNSDLGASADPNHRYLSLTGVILELDHVADVVVPQMERLKTAFFRHHPDEPLILHRKELMNKKYPFAALRDAVVESQFNEELLGLLRSWDYVVITVVMDKLEHKNRYHVWRYDPYHYCLRVLVERFVLWLRAREEVGDVMAESRQGREDRRLKDSFARVYAGGTEFIPPSEFEERLTSSQLKVKPKANNIAGLQLADLIAHPSFRGALARKNRQGLPANFGGQIAAILEACKYNRSPGGQIEGWGRKWLP